MSRPKLLAAAALALAALLAAAPHATSSSTPLVPDAYDDAERAADTFLRSVAEIKRLNVDELRRLVSAICDAEEEDRRAVAREASSRVKDKVGNEYDKLERMKTDALTLLTKVIGDDAFKDKRGRAEDYKRKVEEGWNTVERMTRSVRGANHPVVAFMLEKGQEVHKDYQNSSSRCTVSEWTVGSGRADCLYASSCEVIELKPNNSRAVSKGRDQARNYADAINRPDELARLKRQHSAFSGCDKLVPRVRCYTLCPEIDDNGEFRSVSADWRDCS